MAKKQVKKPAAKPHVALEVPPRQDPKITDKLYWGRIHWVVGTTPKGMTRNDVTDPPTNGSQCCFVIPGDKRWMVFCPVSFSSYQVTVGGYEQKTFEGSPTPFDPAKLADWLIAKWETFAEHGNQVDYNMAARVIKELGGKVPTVVPMSTDEDPNKERGGKPVADNLVKPVKRTSKRGKVLEWFIETGEARSIREAMAEFDTTRSNVLSYLHNLNKDHGIGYRLVGDTALVELPADCGDNPWAS